MMVAFVGFIGCGKDTAADILVKEYGWVRDAFAAPVKDAVAAIFGWDRTMLEGSTKDSRVWREQPDPFWSDRFERPFSPREALQIMGTEAGRKAFHPNLWLDALARRRKPGVNYVISDARFKNEIAWVQGAGGLVVRIKRGPEPDWFPEACEYNYDCLLAGKELIIDPSRAIAKVHQSERDWCGNPLVEYEIDNNGNLHAFSLEIAKLVDFMSKTNFA